MTNQRKRFKTWAIISACLLLMLLSACDGSKSKSTDSKGKDNHQNTPANTNVTDNEGQGTPNNGGSTNEPVDSGKGNDGNTATDGKQPAATKEIELTLEGNQEKRTGTLAESDQGYYLYVLSNYKLTSEEPGSDQLYWENDDTFAARIELLPSDASTDDLQQNARTELKEIGAITEMKDEDIFEPFFRKAEFFLHAGNDSLSKNIVLIKIDGKLFKITMSLPNSEPAEGAAPSFWAMLATIQPK